MKLSTMRRIDVLVGQPATFLLSLFFKLFGGLLRRRAAGGRRRVLFIELSEMGSTILAAPSFQRLRERNPQVEMSFVIFSKNAPSLRLLEIFDERNIFTIRDDGLLAMATDVVRFAFFCRARAIDTTIDLELFSRISSILSLLSCAGTRVGFDNFLGEGLYRGAHLTHRVQYNPYYHMSQNFVALVDALEEPPDAIPLVKRAIPLPPMTVRVPIKRAEYDYVRAELGKLIDLTRRPRLVLLNHDAGKLLPIRTWPGARFAEVARRLLAHDPRVVVVLVGIPDATESAREIVGAVGDPRCVDFTGRTRTLADLVQLFHQAELLITNDSGPAHFASLTEMACITLFGPETSKLYGPIGPRAVNVYKGLACSPCLTAINHRNSPCTDNKCLQEITPGEVFEQARMLLSATAGTAPT
jgi:ADP-heptose:LPS heptosyltransferase